jgi:hypothetical protein
LSDARYAMHKRAPRVRIRVPLIRIRLPGQ